MRTEQEIEHAIKRYEDVRDGCLQMKLEAHAQIAGQTVETLKWVLGQKTPFTDMLCEIDSQIASALAHTN